jgi:hypothetical protein
MKHITKRRPSEQLPICRYGDCQERLPLKDTYIVRKPASMGSPRYCGAPHALLALASVVGVHNEVLSILKEKGF